MSFHFRKLRSLRLMPTAKRSLGFGFSTRVNDKEKSVCNETAPAMETGSLPNEEEYTLELNPTSLLSFLREDSGLLPIVPAPSSVIPVSLSDLQFLVLDRALALKGNSSIVKLHKTDVLDVFSSRCVKSVNFTSDDILVDPMGLCDLGFNRSACERIPVEVLAHCPSKDLEDKSGHFQSKNSRHPFIPEISRSPSVVPSSPDTVAALPNPLHEPEVASSHNALHMCSSQTLYCSSGGAGGSNKTSKDGPSQEQIHNAREKLEHMVSNLFKGSQDYSMLHKNVTLENNLFGDNKVCRGTTMYALEFLKLRLQVHMRYSSTEMEIMNVSTLEQNGIIRIHWRLKGVPQTELLKVWKFFKITKDDVEWLEAFSYFHIGKDGLVHKHRIDRMMPDNEREVNKLTDKLQKVLNPAKPLVS